MFAFYPPATWPPWPVIKPTTLDSVAKKRNHLATVANTQVCLGIQNCIYKSYIRSNVLLGVLLQNFRYPGAETRSRYLKDIFAGKRMHTMVKTSMTPFLCMCEAFLQQLMIQKTQI